MDRSEVLLHKHACYQIQHDQMLDLNLQSPICTRLILTTYKSRQSITISQEHTWFLTVMVTLVYLQFFCNHNWWGIIFLRSTTAGSLQMQTVNFRTQNIQIKEHPEILKKWDHVSRLTLHFQLFLFLHRHHHQNLPTESLDNIETIERGKKYLVFFS